MMWCAPTCSPACSPLLQDPHRRSWERSRKLQGNRFMRREPSVSLQGNIMRLPTGKDDMPDGPPSMSIRTVAAPEDGHPSPRIRTVADSAEGALEPLSLRRGHESRGSPGQRHRLHLHNEVPPPIASFTHRLQSSAPGFRRLALAAPFWTEGAWEIVMVPPPPAREVREPVHRGMAGVSSGRSRSGWIP